MTISQVLDPRMYPLLSVMKRKTDGFLIGVAAAILTTSGDRAGGAATPLSEE